MDCYEIPCKTIDELLVRQKPGCNPLQCLDCTQFGVKIRLPDGFTLSDLSGFALTVATEFEEHFTPRAVIAGSHILIDPERCELQEDGSKVCILSVNNDLEPILCLPPGIYAYEVSAIDANDNKLILARGKFRFTTVLRPEGI